MYMSACQLSILFSIQSTVFTVHLPPSHQLVSASRQLEASCYPEQWNHQSAQYAYQLRLTSPLQISCPRLCCEVTAWWMFDQCSCSCEVLRHTGVLTTRTHRVAILYHFKSCIVHDMSLKYGFTNSAASMKRAVCNYQVLCICFYCLIIND